MKDDVLFDSDKCIWKRDFGYDSMSLKEFDEYANIAATFAGHLIGNYEHLSVEMNRLKKTFHISIFFDAKGRDDTFVTKLCGYESYESGNIRFIDDFFGILNNEYGLAANNLRIPKYPTLTDGNYSWHELYSEMRNFIIDFKYHNTIYDKIRDLYKKYFAGWIFENEYKTFE